MKVFVALMLLSINFSYAGERSDINITFSDPVSIRIPNELMPSDSITDFNIGMSVDDINSTIKRKYSGFMRNDVFRPLDMTASKEGFTVRGTTPDFLNEISISRTDGEGVRETYNFHLTSPRTGSRLFNIHRYISYESANGKPMVKDIEEKITSKFDGVRKDTVPMDGENPAFVVHFRKSYGIPDSRQCLEPTLDTQYFYKTPISTIMDQGRLTCTSLLHISFGADRAGNVLDFSMDILSGELYWNSVSSDMFMFLDKFDAEIDRMKMNQKSNALSAPAL